MCFLHRRGEGKETVYPFSSWPWKRGEGEGEGEGKGGEEQDKIVNIWHRPPFNPGPLVLLPTRGQWGTYSPWGILQWGKILEGGGGDEDRFLGGRYKKRTDSWKGEKERTSY